MVKIVKFLVRIISEHLLKAMFLMFEMETVGPCLVQKRRWSRRAMFPLASPVATPLHNDCCEVYNSLSSEKITVEVADKVANILYCIKPEIKILIKSVQQQRNCFDCGVFAIVLATSPGFGDRPEEIIYDSKIMRQHLLNCLRNKRIERFPVQDGNTIQHCKRKTLVIEVFCSCRQPYYPVMVMCTKCEEWFHVDCERIQDLL